LQSTLVLKRTAPKDVVKNLISYQKTAEHLKPVYFDDQAQEAVRKNNKEIIDLNQAETELCGNVEAFFALPEMRKRLS
jgi:hypothetical protein